jgi:NADPH:quinone reductase-like Zn-dependent oxidoreductase
MFRQTTNGGRCDADRPVDGACARRAPAVRRASTARSGDVSPEPAGAAGPAARPDTPATRKIMKAQVLDRYGRKRALKLADVPTPELREDEVLVEVHAAGVNLLDAKLRNGEFKLILPYQFPLVLGHDVAGVIVRVGPRVRQFKVGDAIYARVDDFRIGTFAEFVPVKEASLALKPKNLTMEEAAAVPLVALTAWQALVETANVKKGQKVFIQAGSGGVGTFAIQLAKHLGATVATTTSAANVALVKGLGADIVVDYKAQDFEQILRDYDVVLNSQDGKTLDKSLRVLKAGGKLISISGPPDPAFGAEIGAAGFIKLVLRLLSWGIRRRSKARNVLYSFLFMKANGGQLREIGRLLEAGVVRPVIDRIVPFEQTNEALAYVEAGRAKGKVVIKVR